MACPWKLLDGTRLPQRHANQSIPFHNQGRQVVPDFKGMNTKGTTFTDASLSKIRTRTHAAMSPATAPTTDGSANSVSLKDKYLSNKHNMLAVENMFMRTVDPDGLKPWRAKRFPQALAEGTERVFCAEGSVARVSTWRPL